MKFTIALAYKLLEYLAGYPEGRSESELVSRFESYEREEITTNVTILMAGGFVKSEAGIFRITTSGKVTLWRGLK